MDNPWRNRIVGHDEIDPGLLLANPRNWRIHPDEQQEALSDVLDDVGWVDEVMVNKTTNFVVDGHLRVALALRNEVPTVPVKYVELTQEEEWEVLRTLDPLAAMAFADAEKLDDLIAVGDSSEAVNKMLQDLRQATVLPGTDEWADMFEGTKPDEFGNINFSFSLPKDQAAIVQTALDQYEGSKNKRLLQMCSEVVGDGE